MKPCIGNFSTYFIISHHELLDIQEEDNPSPIPMCPLFGGSIAIPCIISYNNIIYPTFTIYLTSSHVQPTWVTYGNCSQSFQPRPCKKVDSLRRSIDTTKIRWVFSIGSFTVSLQPSFYLFNKPNHFVCIRFLDFISIMLVVVRNKLQKGESIVLATIIIKKSTFETSKLVHVVIQKIFRGHSYTTVSLWI